MAGLYSCTQRCSPYPNVPSYCVMVQDPQDQCCEKPSCPGLVPPTPRPTPGPGPNTNNPPTPGPSFGPGPNTQPPVTNSPTATPYPTLFPPINTPNPPPGGVPTPAVPKNVCLMNGKSYTQGQ